MLKRSIQSFSPRSQPLMTRQSYRHEIAAAATFPVAMSLLEGAVISVMAKDIFNVNDLAFATILAAPMFANLTSTLWARLSRGRRKVPFICTLMTVILLIDLAIATLPVDEGGGVALVGLAVLSRCMAAGIITVRSNIWRTNYPRHLRGKITGRFILAATLIMAIAPLIGYAVQDLDSEENPMFFRVIYGLSAIIGTVGVFEMSRIRLRRERVQLAFERAQRPSHVVDTRTDGGAYDHRIARPDGRHHNFFSVLRHDHRFRAYMVWQFLAGTANMMGNTAIIRYIVEVLRDHKFEQSLGVLLTATIPTLCLAISLPFWARFLDRVHITTYRTRHGLLWIAGQACNFIIASTGLNALLFVPRIINGFMMGGGTLAWQLGHNDFADRRLVALYMGIHQTLTGIRGAFAPFLGVFLLMGWDRFGWFGWTVPAFAGIGADVFLITTALSVSAWLGFCAMHLRHVRDRRAHKA